MSRLLEMVNLSRKVIHLVVDASSCSSSCINTSKQTDRQIIHLDELFTLVHLSRGTKQIVCLDRYMYSVVHLFGRIYTQMDYQLPDRGFVCMDYPSLVLAALFLKRSPCFLRQPMLPVYVHVYIPR